MNAEQLQKLLVDLTNQFYEAGLGQESLPNFQSKELAEKIISRIRGEK
jgi:hypothetical protein